MTNPRTTMDPPPFLGLPRDEPVPPSDCGVCAALVRQRAEARARGDVSRVSDYNVEIRPPPAAASQAEEGVSGSEPGPRAIHRPQRLVVPDHLPGETEYGIFINHMTGCADCGYGQVQCEQATKLWQAYKEARRPPKRRT